MKATTETKPIVSEEEAFAIIAQYAPAVQLLEVVSDTYADPVSLEYHQTHEVPGFFQISSDRFETAPSWNLKSDEEMIKVLEEYAITPDTETRILLFDNIQINCGQAKSRFDASARIYSVLKYFGVKHVSIIMDNAMNEHFEDEYAANHPDIVRKLSSNPVVMPKGDSVPAEPSTPEPSESETTGPKYGSELMARSAATFHRTTQVKTGQHEKLTKSLYAKATGDRPLVHPDPVRWHQDVIKQGPLGKDEIVPYETVVELIAGELGSYKIIDARSLEEHEGHVTGYEYVTASGKIPTSQSVSNADYQLSVDHSLADVLSRLETVLKDKGVSKDERIIWYCGTGWRAARMCTLTQLLGYTNVGIYEGGWSEWYQRNPQDIVQQ